MRFYIRFKNHQFLKESHNDNWGPIILKDNQLLKDFASYLENGKSSFGFYETNEQGLVIDFRDIDAIHSYTKD